MDRSTKVSLRSTLPEPTARSDRIALHGVHKSPFTFSVTVKKALVDITGEAVEDQAAQMKVYLARQ